MFCRYQDLGWDIQGNRRSAWLTRMFVGSRVPSGFWWRARVQSSIVDEVESASSGNVLILQGLPQHYRRHLHSHQLISHVSRCRIREKFCWSLSHSKGIMLDTEAEPVLLLVPWNPFKATVSTAYFWGYCWYITLLLTSTVHQSMLVW